MKLSNQAMGALMMALQKSLLEQTDIVPVLQGFIFEQNEHEELTVCNPPNFKIGNDTFNSNLLTENNKTTGSD
jgi:23S rRNA A1618 N6-methylase RlmF|tara:strand:- start:27 stop:245 length:219 start_codon:yes stop_codon:yes gene_type:complete